MIINEFCRFGTVSAMSSTHNMRRAFSQPVNTTAGNGIGRCVYARQPILQRQAD